MSAIVVLLSCFVICLAEEWAYSKIKKERLSVPQLVRLWLLTFSVSYLRTLFSDEETLLERYGTDYVSHELTKKSDFYNRQLAGS